MKRHSEHFALGRVIFWASNVPVVLLAYIFVRSTWIEASLLYLALISVDNNIETSYAGYVAKKAERKSQENPPPKA